MVVWSRLIMGGNPMTAEKLPPTYMPLWVLLGLMGLAYWLAC